MPTGAYLKVSGADKLAHTQKMLRELGDKEISRQLYRGLNRAVKPMRAAAKEGAREGIGNKHGYGEQVAAQMRVTARRRTGKNPSLRIVAKRGKSRLGRLDKGELRHPTFGRWTSRSGASMASTTRIESGWWEKALRREAPAVRREIAKTITEVRAAARQKGAR